VASPYVRTARELVAGTGVGFLATHLKKKPGYPYVSLAPYTTDSEGRPVFLFSGLAAHTKNLDQDSHASLLVTARGVFDDPRGSARVTLIGRVEPVAEEDVQLLRTVHLSARPEDAQLMELADFRFFRMAIDDIHFVGGFGEAGWIAPSDYMAHPGSGV
jgi:heme iron utilization protein